MILLSKTTLPALRGLFSPYRGPRLSGTVLPAIVIAACSTYAFSQAITVSTSNSASIDRRYLQVTATKVDLPTQPIDARGHQDILRILTAEQGFAMRPLPRGKKGMVLEANGKLTPAGEGYVARITEQGLSVKPGERIVFSNVKIDRDRIIFDINGGPEHKHEFLRHISIGAGGPNQTQSITPDDGQDPTGSRITLVFPKFLPEVTPTQIKALLAPLINFDIKSPAQAYTDTLPPTLKAAILSHHVLVGMTTDMVLIALGPPETKSREIDGQMPFEEWIYGHPPQDVDFVRVNGNRVIRVEVAKVGQPIEVFDKDEVQGLMMSDGRPVLAEGPKERHSVQLGDVHRDADTQSPVAPPTLRAPGEKLPTDAPASDQQDPTANREGAMKPVIFPKDTGKDPARTVPAHPKPAPPPDDSTPAASPAPAPATPSVAPAPATSAPPPTAPNHWLSQDDGRLQPARN